MKVVIKLRSRPRLREWRPALTAVSGHCWSAGLQNLVLACVCAIAQLPLRSAAIFSLIRAVLRNRPGIASVIEFILHRLRFLREAMSMPENTHARSDMSAAALVPVPSGHAIDRPVS